MNAFSHSPEASTHNKAEAKPWAWLLLITALLVLQACSSASKRPSTGSSPTTTSRPPAGDPVARSGGAPSVPVPPSGRPGGYYADDGPGEGPPDVNGIPDAVPKNETLATRANRPYSIFGIQYLPLTQLKPYRERGMASWYGKKFHGQPTSIGERYDMYAMSAAHPTLPLPSYAKVTNPRNGKTVVVRVNDRGPFLHNRIIDLSYTAAAKLGYVQNGSTEVEVELIDRPEAFKPTGVALAAASPPSTISTNPQPPATSTAPTNVPTVEAPSKSATILPVAAAPEDAALVLTRETMITPAQPQAAPGLYLQLGAFGAKDGGDAMRLRLEQQFPWLSTNSPDKTSLSLKQDGQIFKLQVGPYKTRQAAQESIERLKLESGLQAFVVTR